MNYQYGPNPPQYPPPYPPQYQPYPAYHPLPPDPWNALVRKNANIICFGLILVFLLALSMSPLLGTLADYYIDVFNVESQGTISAVYMICDLLAGLIMLLIPMTIIRLWIGIPAKVAFPMRRPRASIAFPAVLVCLGASIVGSTLSGLISVFFETFFGTSPYMPDLPQPVGAVATVIFLIRMCAYPAVGEELLSRGVIMQSLRRFGDSFALICSSILFSLAHYNLQQGPSVLIVGLVIGFFVLRTGSLRVGIAAHFINNLIAVSIDLLSYHNLSFNPTIANSLVFAFYCIAGLIGIIMLSFRHSGILKLAPSQYPVPEKKKYSLFFLSIVPIIYIIIVTVLTVINFY